MASALAVLGNAQKYHRFFDLSIFAAILAGYVLLVGSLASMLEGSPQTSDPGTEQPQACHCSSIDEPDQPVKAATADLQWTSARVVTAENCS